MVKMSRTYYMDARKGYAHEIVRLFANIRIFFVLLAKIFKNHVENSCHSLYLYESCCPRNNSKDQKASFAKVYAPTRIEFGERKSPNGLQCNDFK